MMRIEIYNLFRSPHLDLKTGDEEQVDPEDGTWQTGSNRNVGAALPFTDPTPGLAISNITFSSTHLELLTFFFNKISDVDTC